MPAPPRGAAAEDDGSAPKRSAEDLAVAKRVESALCRDGGCCVTDVWRLSPDHRRHPLAVVALESNEACLLPQKPSRASREGDSDDKGTDGDDSDDRHPCSEYRLVDLGTKKPGAGRQLTKQCDGDHSEVSAGVDVEARTFTYGGHSMYTNDQWIDETVLGLDPLRVVAFSRSTNGRGQSHEEKWNWETFAGDVELGVNYCQGKAPWSDGGTPPDSDMPDLVTAALRIPRVTLPAAFLADGWRTTRLGRCAARVDGEKGFTIHGAKGAAADSSMSVLFSAHDAVFVEIGDDRFVSGGKSWVSDDHLEIWTTTRNDPCVDPKESTPAVQWGVRVLDGAVFPGFGNPAVVPRVEVHRAGNVVRLKLDLEGAIGASASLTIVYSDSDDGRHQKRLIATSELSYGKWWTFGEAPAAQDGASCIVSKGVLEPRHQPLALPD